MKFKWWYVTWVLPVSMLYGLFYCIYKYQFLDHWWSIPTGIMVGVLIYVSTVFAVYLFVEDK